MSLTAISDQTLTVGASDVSLTVPSTAHRCYIEIWDADIYYTLDGATPSSTNGGRAVEGDTLTFLDGNARDMMQDLRMIRQGGVSATAIVHYLH